MQRFEKRNIIIDIVERGEKFEDRRSD